MLSSPLFSPVRVLHAEEAGQLPTGVIRLGTGRFRHPGYVTALDYSPDGKQLVTSCTDQVIRLWDVKSGRLIKILTGHLDYVNHVNFSPSDKHIVSFSPPGKTVRLWCLRTGEQIGEPIPCEGELRAMGRKAEPTLRAVDRRKLSLEARRSVDLLLRHLSRPKLMANKKLPPKYHRLMNVVLILDQIGTSEAYALLRRIATNELKLIDLLALSSNDENIKQAQSILKQVGKQELTDK